MFVLIFLCLIMGVVSHADKGSDKKVEEFVKPRENVMKKPNPNLTDVQVIMERQRQLETIRLSEVWTKRALRETKARSEELTLILEKRLNRADNLFKRLPFIVGYLINRDGLGATVELPTMSRMFLMASMGRGENRVTELSDFFESYFKMMNASRSTTEVRNLQEFALKEMVRLSQLIGNTFFWRTMDEINSTQAFMKSSLTGIKDMLLKLPELLYDEMYGPYDTVSEDRIIKRYRNSKRSE